ncbi:Conserved_hypothetical protein [Hexamita inflata]|uniref:Uncharacterized protein n=1 Tax=Hexamita inflata TaxID=28002 RepID=A0AA86RJ21_9EUKA|nr:Conserved hypothetical protein [Hexamita inflata]
MYEDLLNCNVTTDHLEPKSVMPIFSEYINQAETELLTRPFEKLREDLDISLNSFFGSTLEQASQSKLLSEEIQQQLFRQNMIEKQLHEIMQHLIQQKAIDRSKLLAQINFLTEQLYMRRALNERYKPDFGREIDINFGDVDIDIPDSGFIRGKKSDPNKNNNTYQQIISDLKASLQKYQITVRELLEEIERYKAIEQEKLELKDLYEIRQTALYNKEKELNEALEKMRIMNEMLIENQHLIDELNRRNEELNTNLTQKQVQNQRLADESKQIQEQNEAHSNQQSQQITQLLNKLEVLNNTVQEKTDALNDLSSSIQAQATNKSEANWQMDAERKKQEELQKQVDALNQKIKTMEMAHIQAMSQKARTPAPRQAMLQGQNTQQAGPNQNGSGIFQEEVYEEIFEKEIQTDLSMMTLNPVKEDNSPVKSANSTSASTKIKKDSKSNNKTEINATDDQETHNQPQDASQKNKQQKSEQRKSESTRSVKTEKAIEKPKDEKINSVKDSKIDQKTIRKNPSSKQVLNESSNQKLGNNQNQNSNQNDKLESIQEQNNSNIQPNLSSNDIQIIEEPKTYQDVETQTYIDGDEEQMQTESIKQSLQLSSVMSASFVDQISEKPQEQQKASTLGNSQNTQGASNQQSSLNEGFNTKVSDKRRGSLPYTKQANYKNDINGKNVNIADYQQLGNSQQSDNMQQQQNGENQQKLVQLHPQKNIAGQNTVAHPSNVTSVGIKNTKLPSAGNYAQQKGPRPSVERSQNTQQSTNTVDNNMDVYDRTPLSQQGYRENSDELKLDLDEQRVRFIDNDTELMEGCQTQTDFNNIDLQQSQTQTEFLTKSPQRKELEQIQTQLIKENILFHKILKENVQDDEKYEQRLVGEDLLESLFKQQKLIEQFKNQLQSLTNHEYNCIEDAEEQVLNFLNRRERGVQTIIGNGNSDQSNDERVYSDFSVAEGNKTHQNSANTYPIKEPLQYQRSQTGKDKRNTNKMEFNVNYNNGVDRNDQYLGLSQSGHNQGVFQDKNLNRKPENILYSSINLEMPSQNSKYSAMISSQANSKANNGIPTSQPASQFGASITSDQLATSQNVQHPTKSRFLVNVQADYDKTKAALQLANIVLERRGLRKIAQSEIKSAEELLMHLQNRKIETKSFELAKQQQIQEYQRGRVFQTLYSATAKMSNFTSMMIISTQELKKHYTLLGMKLVRSELQPGQKVKFDTRRMSAAQKHMTNKVKESGINQTLNMMTSRSVLKSAGAK